MNLEKTYERARIHPAHRQEFLDTVPLLSAQKYVRHVAYIPYDVRKPLAILLMATLVHPLTAYLKIEHVPSKINVHPVAFEYELPDFLSILIHHEGTHAREFYEQPRNVLRPTYRLKDLFSTLSYDEWNKRVLKTEQQNMDAEIRATQAELQNLHGFQLTDKYRAKRLRYLDHFREKRDCLEKKLVAYR
jgi:hypothetical protein